MSSLRQQIQNGLTTFYVRQQRIVIGLVCAGILAGGYFLLLSARVTEIQGNRLVTLREKSALLKERQSYAERQKMMVSRFTTEVMPADIAFVNRVVPEAPDVANLISIVGDMAAKAGFQVGNFSVAEEFAIASNSAAASTTSPLLGRISSAGDNAAAAVTPVGRHLSLRLDLRGKSNYESLRTLLAAIEKSDRIFDVGTLTFTLRSVDTVEVPGTTSTSTGGTYQLSLVTQYLPVTTSTR